jgi:hypothetical protein
VFVADGVGEVPAGTGGDDLELVVDGAGNQDATVWKIGSRCAQPDADSFAP